MIISLILILVVLGFIVSLQPNAFKVARQSTMRAPASVIFAQINDFHLWQAWSPWAKLDPDAVVTFEGPASGVGAVMRWIGNNRVGSGSATIIESVPDQRVKIRLDFLKPIASTSTSDLTIAVQGEQCLVTWSMVGDSSKFIMKAMGLIMNCEKMVSAQYDEGLANMKAIVEAK